MSFPDEIRKNAFHVLTLPTEKHLQPKFYVPLHKIQGLGIAIIVENIGDDDDDDDDDGGGGGGGGEGGVGKISRKLAGQSGKVIAGLNSTSAYITLVNYGCDLTNMKSCNDG